MTRWRKGEPIPDEIWCLVTGGWLVLSALADERLGMDCRHSKLAKALKVPQAQVRRWWLGRNPVAPDYIARVQQLPVASMITPEIAQAQAVLQRYGLETKAVIWTVAKLEIWSQRAISSVANPDLAAFNAAYVAMRAYLLTNEAQAGLNELGAQDAPVEKRKTPSGNSKMASVSKAVKSPPGSRLQWWFNERDNRWTCKRKNLHCYVKKSPQTGLWLFSIDDADRGGVRWVEGQRIVDTDVKDVVVSSATFPSEDAAKDAVWQIIRPQKLLP